MKDRLFRYKNASLPAHERVEDLLTHMSVEEKIAQLRSQMLFDPEDPHRDHTVGNVRSLTHFAHGKERRRTPEECAEINNADIRRSIAASRWGIPVLVAGSAVTMQRWEDKAEAIVLPWYGGEQGGTAIADVLFGRSNPGGKLPITFPKTVGQCPLYYNPKPTGRAYHYNDNDGKPLFPFGHGLSYSSFAYSNLLIAPAEARAGVPVTVSVRIRNTSAVDGDEVVQVYVHDRLASVARPVKQLCGFQRIHLAAGEEKHVSFTLEERHLALWDAQMQRVVEPGDYEVMIGSSSQDIRLTGILKTL